MPALDDYARPVPAWLLIAATLAATPNGASVSQLVRLADARVPGRGPSRQTILAVLARMVDDGTVTPCVRQDGARTPAHIHFLTEAGRALYRDARVLTIHALGLPDGTTQKKAQRKPRHRRQ